MLIEFHHYLLLINFGIFVLSFLFVLIFYERIRSQFSAQVNCWFCNENARVPYNERNGFICPSCKQYNGFNSEGNYNKHLPEQHDEMLNPLPFAARSDLTKKTKTLLCQFCNNNQQLKVYQLANFVPLNELNYDVEIEHFQKQLEKAYKLCAKCDKVLRRRIAKQNKWMLGLKVLEWKRLGSKSFNNSTIIKTTNGCKLLIPTVMFIFTTLISLYFYSNAIRNLMKPYLDLEIIQEYFESTFGDYFLVLHHLHGVYVIASSAILILTIIALIIIILNKKKRKVEKVVKEDLRSLNSSFVNSPNISNNSCAESFYSMNAPVNSTDISTESIDSDYEAFNAAIKQRKKKFNKTQSIISTTSNQTTLPDKPIFGEPPRFDNPLNRSKSPFDDLNSSFASYRRRPSGDLNFSLSNLNLKSFDEKSFVAPATKFRNPWTGGYWDQRADLYSCSSSQSSGIFSTYQHDVNNSLPNSRANSIYGDDHCSLFSEPPASSYNNRFGFNSRQLWDAKSLSSYRSGRMQKLSEKQDFNTNPFASNNFYQFNHFSLRSNQKTPKFFEFK